MVLPRLAENQLRLAICTALALGTLLLYWPVTHHDFINVDDPRFVTQNEHVRAGFTWSGVVWALHTGYTENWHPLTWFSHMLDCQLYGLKPGGHHFTNLLFHIANTVLLFLWLNGLTRAPVLSGWVAAFFAWHPLHVESVAWICERKDMLSTFFWLLTLMAYTRYARMSGVRSYLLVLGLFALGLMSKPMVVTLPCVLLLLDFWPLNRFELNLVPENGVAAALDYRRFGKKAAILLAEKIPFFLLSAVIGVVTVQAQKADGVVSTVQGMPVTERLANALVSYWDYLKATFWPTDLAFFYPYSFHLPPGLVIGSGLLLAICTAWFVVRARKQPFLLVGWLWFLGTLVPAIGLVQVGLQSHADRYMYIPSIGLFIVVVWGAGELCKHRPAIGKFILTLGALALVGCVGVTSVVLSYWQDSISVSRRDLEVVPGNYLAYDSLGRALDERGLKPLALECFSNSVAINPLFPQSQYNLAVALLDAGRPVEAAEHFTEALKVVPNHYEIREQLGDVLLSLGGNRLPDAATQFAEVIRLKPDDAGAHAKLAITLIQQGKPAEALPQFAEAVRLAPADANYHFDYGLALLDSHQSADAAAQFAAEIELTPAESKAHFRLAQALQQQGALSQAAGEYREALRLNADFTEARSALDRILSAHPAVQ